ncbi:hypothetical protein [Acinetobacter sp. ANC 5502]
MKNEKFLERILIVLSYMIFILVIGLLARFMNEVINIASKLQDKHSTFSFMSYLIAMLQVSGIKGLITIILALLGLYISIKNYLRKHGNKVAAAFGIANGERTLIIVNKKGKPLIINSFYFLLNDKVFVQLECEGTNHSVTNFEIVKPYETLVKVITGDRFFFQAQEIENFDKYLDDQNIKREIFLHTVDGLIRCDFLKIEPLVIKLMKNNKFLLVQNISSPRSVLNDKEVINFDKYLY